MKHIIILINALFNSNSTEVKPCKFSIEAKQTKFKVTFPLERPSNFNEWSQHIHSLRK